MPKPKMFTSGDVELIRAALAEAIEAVEGTIDSFLPQQWSPSYRKPKYQRLRREWESRNTAYKDLLARLGPGTMRILTTSEKIGRMRNIDDR